jgi:hypothetical protein
MVYFMHCALSPLRRLQTKGLECQCGEHSTPRAAGAAAAVGSTGMFSAELCSACGTGLVCIHVRTCTLCLTEIVCTCVLLSAAAYQIPAVGRDGSVRPFEKPWFMVLLMFAGRAECGVGVELWVWGLGSNISTALHLNNNG